MLHLRGLSSTKIAGTVCALSFCNTIISKSSSCSSGQKKFQAISLPLKDKIVLITGATAGIGKACAWQFANAGSKLILVGRRDDKLLKLKNDLEDVYPGIRVHTSCLSVADMDAVASFPASLPVEFAEVDILVNNAGLALGVTSVDTNSVKDAEVVIQTNILGMIAMCSAFIPGMKERGRGHVINMGSVAGHYAYATGSVYNASKFAVHGFTMAARHDLAGTPIRVTHISPGLCGNTEFSNVRLKDDSKAAAVYDGIEALSPENIADTVVYAASRPVNVQIADIILYCTNQSGPRDIVRAGPSLGAPSK